MHVLNDVRRRLAYTFHNMHFCLHSLIIYESRYTPPKLGNIIISPLYSQLLCACIYSSASFSTTTTKPDNCVLKCAPNLLGPKQA